MFDASDAGEDSTLMNIHETFQVSCLFILHNVRTYSQHILIHKPTNFYICVMYICTYHALGWF